MFKADLDFDAFTTRYESSKFLFCKLTHRRFSSARFARGIYFRHILFDLCSKLPLTKSQNFQLTTQQATPTYSISTHIFRKEYPIRSSTNTQLLTNQHIITSLSHHNTVTNSNTQRIHRIISNSKNHISMDIQRPFRGFPWCVLNYGA
jgi:hypothetical protein